MQKIIQKCFHHVKYLLAKRDPVKLAAFLGVNFPRGGATYLWGCGLEY